MTMSTCSTATSAACHLRGDGQGGHARRRPGCGSGAVVACCGGTGGGRLERKLRDLEQSWDAYKTGRSDPPPRHRRSCSDTATGSAIAAASSAAVTGASPDTPRLLLLPVLRGSPKKLLSSLRQTGSSSGGGGGSSSASAGAGVTVGDGKSGVRLYEEDASSVCSVDAAVAMAASSCSCSCQCTVLCCACGCGCGCSSSSSCSGSAASTSRALFSLREEAVAGEVRKREEGRWAMGSVGQLAAIAVMGVVVLGAMAAAVLEFGMDDGYVEFLVPT